MRELRASKTDLASCTEVGFVTVNSDFGFYYSTAAYSLLYNPLAVPARPLYRPSL
jgi:hypothetical protein